MFCCLRTRGRKERKLDDRAASPNAKAQPPPAFHGYENNSGRSRDNGFKDGNMVVLAGAGAAVAAMTVATAADRSDQRGGGSGGGVDNGGVGTISQGCCCGDGGCGGGGCGGGGCGGGGCGGGCCGGG